MKKMFVILVALLLSVALVIPAFAFKGPVVAKDDNVVTMEAEGQLPPWVAEGALAKVNGNLGKVTAVDGNKVSLKVKKSTAEELKAGDILDVKPKNADPSQMLQGC